MKKNQQGFTLIELLVVIAIIGILSTLAVISLNNARQKAKDAKAVSDIKSIQTALELYYNDFNAYPADDGDKLPTSIATGTQVYMQQVPNDPSGVRYTYHASTTTPPTTYDIPFTLTGSTGNLQAGINSASPGAINWVSAN